MKSSLKNRDAMSAMIRRIEMLSEKHQALWGTMDVNEMLLHCSKALRFVLTDRSDFEKPSIRQALIKFVVFKLLSRIPKNAKAPARIITKGRSGTLRFTKEQGALIRCIQDFYSSQEPFRSLHPRLGYLTTHEWGIMAWMHLDHHMRQFGV